MSLWPRYYKRDGTPYPPGQKGMFQWAADLEKTDERIIRHDCLADGSFVSTVWIGIDMDTWSVIQGLPHAPLIFETMTWDARDEIVDQRRWATENDAIVGHIEAVERQQAKVARENN